MRAKLWEMLLAEMLGMDNRLGENTFLRATKLKGLRFYRLSFNGGRGQKALHTKKARISQQEELMRFIQLL